MKKMLCFFYLVMAWSSIVSAQKFDSSKLRKELPTPRITGQTAVRPILDIELFAQPNFSGRRGNFTLMSDGKLLQPFPITNISFTVPTGKIVYIKKCDQSFPTEDAYSESQSSVDLTGICGIRSDDLRQITVNFNGISTVIHNNDCKRFFGEISMLVKEDAPTGTAQSIMRSTTGTYYRIASDPFTFVPFKNASASTSPSYTNYVFNSSSRRPAVTVGNPASVGLASSSFAVGANALRSGRVSISITSNLGSAHKTCDLCDDYSSKVIMSAAVTEAVPINRTVGTRRIDAAHPLITMGPYHAHGSRDGSAITASGGTNLEFKAHFTVTGL